jgi:hypothetical protein
MRFYYPQQRRQQQIFCWTRAAAGRNPLPLPSPPEGGRGAAASKSRRPSPPPFSRRRRRAKPERCWRRRPPSLPLVVATRRGGLVPAVAEGAGSGPGRCGSGRAWSPRARAWGSLSRALWRLVGAGSPWPLALLRPWVAVGSTAAAWWFSCAAPPGPLAAWSPRVGLRRRDLGLWA